MPHRSRLALVVLTALLAGAASAHAAVPSPAHAAAPYERDEVIVRYEGEAAGRTVAVERGESVGETLDELRADPDVDYAVPNYIARVSETIWNDPGASGQPGGWTQLQWNFYGPASINAPEAWDWAERAGAPGGRGVVVAVVDTGVAYQTRGPFKRAPDLHPSRFVRGYDFVDEDRYPNDEFGHGTHVAGTIGQRVNNGIGVTGLAWGAKIMPIRVLDEKGEGDADAIARGIRWAAAHGADIVNLSLEFDASITASQVPDIISALRYAHRRGAIVIAAAGNAADAAVAYPARAQHAISVGATTEHLCQADYSNSGRGLDLAAPGGGNDAPNSDNPWDEQHCHPAIAGRDIYQQTFVRNPRDFQLPSDYQGTSMAAPHVSATAALILASRRLGANPTPAQVLTHLRRTARDLGPAGYDTRYGWGLIDSAAALRPDAAAPPPAAG